MASGSVRLHRTTRLPKLWAFDSTRYDTTLVAFGIKGLAFDRLPAFGVRGRSTRPPRPRSFAMIDWRRRQFYSPKRHFSRAPYIRGRPR